MKAADRLGPLAGAPLAAGVVRAASSLLFLERPPNAVAFLGVAPLLLGVALVASLIPARRILLLDPARVLRNE